eukprot:6461548-Prymnesium_polylepis.1
MLLSTCRARSGSEVLMGVAGVGEEGPIGEGGVGRGPEAGTGRGELDDAQHFAREQEAVDARTAAAGRRARDGGVRERHPAAAGDTRPSRLGRGVGSHTGPRLAGAVCGG